MNTMKTDFNLITESKYTVYLEGKHTMSFLKTLTPVPFILRLLPGISDSALCDRIRLAYGNHGVSSLNHLLNTSKKFQKFRLDRVPTALQNPYCRS